jgi:hypothetical protein
MKGVDKRVKAELSDVLWHNIGPVKDIYEKTLGINFPADIAAIESAIGIRHDVHRNGRGKDGKEITFTREGIIKLVSDVEALVKHIDEQLDKLRKKGAAA